MAPGEAERRGTGKPRDPETGLDDFGARYNSSALGRFMTPDWSAQAEPVPYAKLDDPQSLNLYSYVLNNPVTGVDADGHACSALLENTTSGFCSRAYLYSDFDSSPAIRSQTRFFAAADAVTEALADVASPWSRATVSGSTASFLEGVGKHLQGVNQKEAAAIMRGTLHGPGLDARMVHTEQSQVQKQLDAFRKANPSAYGKAIGEIDAALNPGTAAGALQAIFPTDRAFGEVLDSVRKQLGHGIDFANQADREALGNALIQHARNTGGCDVTGSTGQRLAGC